MTGGLSSLGDDVRSAARGIRGAGDALRGGMTEALDGVLSKEGVAKDQALKEKGLSDMRNTDAHFGQNHGIAANQPTTHTETAHTSATHTNASNVAASQAPGYGSDGRHHGAGSHFQHTPENTGYGYSAPPPPPPPVATHGVDSANTSYHKPSPVVDLHHGHAGHDGHKNGAGSHLQQYAENHINHDPNHDAAAGGRNAWNHGAARHTPPPVPPR